MATEGTVRRGTSGEQTIQELMIKVGDKGCQPLMRGLGAQILSKPLATTGHSDLSFGENRAGL